MKFETSFNSAPSSSSAYSWKVSPVFASMIRRKRLGDALDESPCEFITKGGTHSFSLSYSLRYQPEETP